MNVKFNDDPKKYSVERLSCLDFVEIGFVSKWPLEIIFDSESMTLYNAIFKFLLRIKRVNYIVQLRDFWKRLDTKRPRDMNVL